MNQRLSALDSVWATPLLAMRARLLAPLWWTALPVLLPTMFVLVLNAYLFFNLNPRLGHPADIISFPAEKEMNPALWLSVTPIGHDTVVTTSDRRVFRWPQSTHSLEDVKPLTAYLKRRVEEQVTASLLLGKAFETQSMLVIAADQRLKFLHIRPLLQAIADAGIVRYAFETKTPSVAKSKTKTKKGKASTTESAPE